MKRIILSSIFIMLLTVGFAQDKWRIPSYQHETSVVVKDNSNEIVVSIDGQEKVYKFKKEGEKRVFVNPLEGDAMLNFINIDATRINNKYAAFGGEYNAAEKLIKRAAELPGSTMLIGMDSPSVVQEPQEEGALNTTETKTSDNNSLFQNVIFGIVGLALGIGIAQLFKKKKVETPQPQLSEKQVDQKNSTSSDQVVKQLKAQLATSEKRINDLEIFDKMFYKSAYDKLVVPAQKALEKNDTQEASKLIMQSWLQLTSVTKAKISAKQAFDEQNLRLLVEGKKPSDGIKDVVSSTPLDTIPNHVLTVMKIMKRLEIEDLNDTIVSGYRIKSL